jgi:hypothetical protein
LRQRRDRCPRSGIRVFTAALFRAASLSFAAFSLACSVARTLISVSLSITRLAVLVSLAALSFSGTALGGPFFCTRCFLSIFGRVSIGTALCTFGGPASVLGGFAGILFFFARILFSAAQFARTFFGFPSGVSGRFTFAASLIFCSFIKSFGFPLGKAPGFAFSLALLTFKFLALTAKLSFLLASDFLFLACLLSGFTLLSFAAFNL